MTEDCSAGRRVGRRRVLAATAAGGLAPLPDVATQESDVGDGANADGDPITETAVSFDADLDIGQVVELMVAFPSPDHPLVGQGVEFRGFVLNRIETPDDRAAYADAFSWADYHSQGESVFPSRFRPVSLAADAHPPFDDLPGGGDGEDAFFETHDLVRIVGTTDTDQAFYSKYDYPPFLWGVVDADETELKAGSLVTVAGSIGYAGSGGLTDDPGGAYLRVTDARRERVETTLTADTGGGDPVTFVGLHHHGSTAVTTGTRAVEYTTTDSLPNPTGGSLVLQTGTVDAVDATGPRIEADLRADQQEILVGQTRPTGPDGSADPEAAATNTVAVLDRSGSMSATDTRSGASRLTVAKQSARALVNFLRSGNRLGVVSFSSGSRTVARLLRLREGSRSEVREAIDRLRASGSTSIGGGLLRAGSILRDASGPKSIILLSDGEQNTPPAPDQVIPRLKSLGVTVYTIGMGSGADRELLARIADETGGEMRYRPEPGEIRELFQNFSVSTQRWATLTRTSVELTEGESATDTVTVDETVATVQFSQTYPGSTITLTPERPDGTPLTENDADVTHRVGEANEVWFVDDPAAGEWAFTVTGEQLPRPEESVVQVSADSPVRADLFLTGFHYDRTGMYRVELKVTDGDERYAGARVTLTATTGDTTERIELRDDGGGPDPVADDGIYTGYFHPGATGEWTLVATISGGRADGLEREYTRQLRVEQVVTSPIRPYARRESAAGDVTTTGSRGASTGSVLRELAPVGGLVAAVAVVAAIARRYVDR